MTATPTLPSPRPLVLNACLCPKMRMSHSLSHRWPLLSPQPPAEDVTAHVVWMPATASHSHWRPLAIWETHPHPPFPRSRPPPPPPPPQSVRIIESLDYWSVRFGRGRKGTLLLVSILSCSEPQLCLCNYSHYGLLCLLGGKENAGKTLLEQMKCFIKHYWPLL